MEFSLRIAVFNIAILLLLLLCGSVRPELLYRESFDRSTFNVSNQLEFLRFQGSFVGVSILLLDASFVTSLGTVRGFFVYALRPGFVRLQVWENVTSANSGLSFRLAAEHRSEFTLDDVGRFVYVYPMGMDGFTFRSQHTVGFTQEGTEPIIGWHIMTGLVDSSVRGMRTSLIRSFPNINDVIAFRGEAVNRLKFGIQAIVDTNNRSGPLGLLELGNPTGTGSGTATTNNPASYIVDSTCLPRGQLYSFKLYSQMANTDVFLQLWRCSRDTPTDCTLATQRLFTIRTNGDQTISVVPPMRVAECDKLGFTSSSGVASVGFEAVQETTPGAQTLFYEHPAGTSVIPQRSYSMTSDTRRRFSLAANIRPEDDNKRIGAVASTCSSGAAGARRCPYARADGKKELWREVLVGNPDDITNSDLRADVTNQARTVILTADKHLLKNGEVRKFRYYATEAGRELWVQIWRPTAGTNRYTLLTSVRHRPTTVGLQEVTLPSGFQVRDGDRVGFSSSGRSSAVAFTPATDALTQQNSAKILARDRDNNCDHDEIGARPCEFTETISDKKFLIYAVLQPNERPSQQPDTGGGRRSTTPPGGTGGGPRVGAATAGESGLSSAAIIAIVVGSAVGLIAIISTCVGLWYVGRRAKQEQDKDGSAYGVIRDDTVGYEKNIMHY